MLQTGGVAILPMDVGYSAIGGSAAALECIIDAKVRGVIVYPSQIEDAIAATPGTVKEAWQIYVNAVDKTHDTITVAVGAERGFNGDRAELADTIGRALTSRLGLKVPVECAPEGTLPRYEAKAQRVLVREG